MADSMETLKQLRAASIKRQETERTRVEVAKQLDVIVKLQRQKGILSQRLEALLDGSSPIAVNPGENLELAEAQQTLATLKEKISAHNMLGPCGLTVLDVNETTLVVTFTAIWKNLTESFVLKMTLTNDTIKVTGSDIPYFVNIVNILEDCHVDDLPDRMDSISTRLSAYVHRKREVLYVEDEFKDHLKSVSYDQSITTIDMRIYLPGSGRREMTLLLWYSSIENILPESVDFTLGRGARAKVSRDTEFELCQMLRGIPLSTAFPAMMDRLSGGGVVTRRLVATTSMAGEEGE